MSTNEELLSWHRRALADTEALLRDVAPEELRAPTPCSPWDLEGLLEHMVGQNHGFADALHSAGHRDLDTSAFVPRALEGGPAAAWTASAARVASAFAEGVDGPAVSLAEVDADHRLPPSTVLGIHLLDTVVHAWDVATARGRPYRPAPGLAEIVLAGAIRVPGGEARERPGAAFGPARAVAGEGDAWLRTLAVLGRHPDAVPVGEPVTR